MTLEQSIEKYWEFADKQFDTPAIDSLKGLVREVGELEFEMMFDKLHPAEIIEFADVMFYFIYSLKRRGWTLEQLQTAMATKLSILKNRDWKKNPDNTYSHI